MIRCGSCNDQHETVADVRVCYQGGTVKTKPTVEQLNAFGGKPPITDKQVNYAIGLADRRDTSKLTSTGYLLQQVIENETARKNGFPLRHFISRYDASRLIDEVLSCPVLPDGKTPDTWKTLVPKGRYAVEINGKLRFFFVRRAKTGFSFLKISEQAGPGSYEKKYFEYRQIVEAILEFGIENAGALYGQTLGHCYKCGLELTDETSRSLGIGPVCRTK